MIYLEYPDSDIFSNNKQKNQAMDALLLKKIEDEAGFILSIYKKTKIKYQEENKLSVEFYNLLVRYKDQYRELLDSIESGTPESVNKILSRLPEMRGKINEKLTRKNTSAKKISRYLSGLVEKKDLKSIKLKDREFINTLFSNLEYLVKYPPHPEDLSRLFPKTESKEKAIISRDLFQDQPSRQQAPVIPETEHTFATDLDVLEYSYNNGGVFTRQLNRYQNHIFKRVPVERSDIGRFSIALDKSDNIVSVSCVGRNVLLKKIIDKIKDNSHEKGSSGEILRKYLVDEQLERKPKLLRPFYMIKLWLMRHLSFSPVKYTLPSGNTYDEITNKILDNDRKSGQISKKIEERQTEIRKMEGELDSLREDTADHVAVKQSYDKAFSQRDNDSDSVKSKTVDAEKKSRHPISDTQEQVFPKAFGADSLPKEKIDKSSNVTEGRFDPSEIRLQTEQKSKPEALLSGETKKKFKDSGISLSGLSSASSEDIYRGSQKGVISDDGVHAKTPKTSSVISSHSGENRHPAPSTSNVSRDLPGIEKLFTPEGNPVSEKPFELIHKLRKTYEDGNTERLSDIRKEIERKIKEVEKLSEQERNARAEKLKNKNKEAGNMNLNDFEESYSLFKRGEMINESSNIKRHKTKKTFK